MELPTMPVRLYTSIHADVAEMWRITAEQTMQEAVKKEREAAVSRGDINGAGIAMIPVEAGACWSKRSYKTNYSALSGVAAIIGSTLEKCYISGLGINIALYVLEQIKKDYRHESTIAIKITRDLQLAWSNLY